MRYVLLLRGINVGGKNKVSMNDLKMNIGELGYQNVVTYINSGNVIFDTDDNIETVEIKIAEMAAPIGNVPSTVKSATSNTRKVMNTPTANKDHKRPVVMVPTTKSNIKFSSIVSYLYEELQES